MCCGTYSGFFIGPAVLPALNVIIHNKTDFQPSVWPCKLKLVSCGVFGQRQAEPSTAPVHPWEWPSLPWQQIHTDFASPFLGCMFLIVVDAHSRWLEIEKMDSTTSTKTMEKLQSLFARYGVPMGHSLNLKSFRCSSREMESNI